MITNQGHRSEALSLPRSARRQRMCLKDLAKDSRERSVRVVLLPKEPPDAAPRARSAGEGQGKFGSVPRTPRHLRMCSRRWRRTTTKTFGSGSP